MSLSSSCLLSFMVVFIYIHILIVRYVVFLGYTHVQIANRIHFYLAAKQIGNVKKIFFTLLYLQVLFFGFI